MGKVAKPFGCGTGLSGTSRLHDLFVNIEAMSPAEYRNGGEGLHIEYSSLESVFGTLFVAATRKGICQLAFVEEEAIIGWESSQKLQ